MQIPAGEDKDHSHPLRAYVQSYAWVRPLCLLVGIYVVSFSALLLLYYRLPSLATLAAKSSSDDATITPEELRLSIPRTFGELIAVRRTLATYRTHYVGRLTVFLLAAEVFMQGFMIPGSIVLNVLAGSLYSFPAAVVFSTLGSTLGAGANYLLLRLTLKDALWAAFPGRLATFSQEVRRHRAHLLYYMLFLRVTPLLPAWFINLAAPLVEIPLASVFLPATAIGHQPINVLTAQAGRALNTLSSMRDLYSPGNVLFMLSAGLLALAPVAIRKSRLGSMCGPVTKPAAATSSAVARSPSVAALPMSLTPSQLHEQ